MRVSLSLSCTLFFPSFWYTPGSLPDPLSCYPLLPHFLPSPCPSVLSHVSLDCILSSNFLGKNRWQNTILCSLSSRDRKRFISLPFHRHRHHFSWNQTRPLLSFISGCPPVCWCLPGVPCHSSFFDSYKHLLEDPHSSSHLVFKYPTDITRGLLVFAHNQVSLSIYLLLLFLCLHFHLYLFISCIVFIPLFEVICLRQQDVDVVGDEDAKSFGCWDKWDDGKKAFNCLHSFF